MLSFLLSSDASSDGSLLSFFLENPAHLVIEVILGFAVFYLLFLRKSRSREPRLSEKEVEALIKEWKPQPLPQELSELQKLNSRVPIVSSTPAAYITVNGKQALNLATGNYLGLVENPKVEQAAQAALQKYGCGSCGPRGFYGTIDVHLHLEARIAKFLRTEEAIIYSSGFACISSAIPAFSKRGDLLIVDAGVNYAIKTGLNLSRSTVKFFEHNNVASLEKILEEIRKEDIRTRRKLNRRFVVIEGVYQYSGDISPLKKIMELKDKYCFRVILDDSNAIGVLGKTGRGTCEHWGVNPGDVDLILASMGNSLSSAGGFCAGSKVVVAHQRLNSSGYVFSASLPPYLAVAATTAIDLIDENPKLVEKLQDNSSTFRNALGEIPPLVIEGNPICPIIHLRLPLKPSVSTGDAEVDREIQERDRIKYELVLQQIVDTALEEESIAITRSKYVPAEKNTPDPSIAIFISASHSPSDLKRAATAINAIATAALKDFS
eukprot:TRINITY_DN257_c0_g1_i1.p1 TRINITY_DN257_c0_g1~~TRINITY_DN257_c0_g1_i1.p1  ORF type:complete len:492 (+),score=138.96 TRINITY_DN257_c0_g1_i1:164-1639(+)